MIVITGATGHIGNNFVRLLAQEKIDFRILARKIDESISSFQNHVRIGDIFDVQFLKKQCSKNDVFVHLAGTIDYRNDNLEESILVNDIGTKIIIDFCAEKNIHLVYSSSVDIIDHVQRNSIISEPKNIQIWKSMTNYQLTKAKATMYLEELRSFGKIHATILYPTAVIGIHDYKPSAVGAQIFAATKQRMLYGLRGGYDFIDVEDVAKCILISCQKKINDCIILGHQKKTVRDLYRNILIASKHKAWILPVPRFLASLYCAITHRFTNVMLQALFANPTYDHTKMHKYFPIDYHDIDLTIQKTTQWLTAHENEKKR